MCAVIDRLQMPQKCTPSQRHAVHRIAAHVERERGTDDVTSAAIDPAYARSLRVSIVLMCPKTLRHRHWCIFIGPRGGLTAFGNRIRRGRHALRAVTDTLHDW